MDDSCFTRAIQQQMEKALFGKANTVNTSAAGTRDIGQDFNAITQALSDLEPPNYRKNFLIHATRLQDGTWSITHAGVILALDYHLTTNNTPSALFLPRYFPFFSETSILEFMGARWYLSEFVEPGKCYSLDLPASDCTIINIVV